MSIELGPIWLLGADAVGRPGQRRFRLFVQSARGSAILWMEKEQLNSLSLSLDSVLAHLTEGQVLRIEARSGEQPQPGKMPADFPSIPTYELQVGQLKLGYDEDRDVFLLSATPLELEMEGGARTSSRPYARRKPSRSFSLSSDAQELSIVHLCRCFGGTSALPALSCPARWWAACLHQAEWAS